MALSGTVQLRDGKKPVDMNMGLMEKMALRSALSKIEGTDIEKLLREHQII